MKLSSMLVTGSLFLTCGLGSPRADIIDASLRLRFEFGAAPVNDVVVDTSPSGGHAGTNANAVWLAAELGRNGVMDFTAPLSDRITVAAIPALNSAQGTISFWIKTPGSSGPGEFAAILLDRRTARGDVITLTDDGTIFVQAREGNQNVNTFSTAGTVNDDQWHHIAYVYDQSTGGSISIYIDGALDISQANDRAWGWEPTQPLEIGSSHDAYWKVFNGLMDDFMVHARMLSASEVAATFAGTPVTDDSLVLRLNFQSAPDGDVVADSSPSNNSGTNQGAAWVASDAGRSGLMRFDVISVNRITVAAAPDLDVQIGTIAFWMKSSGNVGLGDFASILVDRREAGNGDIITMADDGTFFIQARGDGLQANSFSTQGRVNDGAWHHVAYVFDQSVNGSIKLYIDGALSGSQTNSTEWFWPVDQPLELGSSHDPYWHAFDGTLDEVRFYDRALTAAEIADIGVAPTIRFDFQPESQTVFVGDEVTIKGLANVEATYQWQHNNATIPNQTNSTLVISNVQAADAGTYTLTATSSIGTATSNPATLTVNPRPSLASSVVARYNFDAAPVNNVIADTAPGAEHPGTNVLATWTATADGRSGVMQFVSEGEGSQFVVSPHAEFNSSLGTIAFWIKSPGTSGPGEFAAIIFDRRTDRGDVITMEDSGVLFVQAQGPSRVNTLETTTTVNDDQWHHVAYVYDQRSGGSTRIYVDGQLTGSQVSSGPWAWDPVQPLEFGKSHDSYWRRLDGYLDDVQIFNRTLTAAEIAEVMSGISGSEAEIEIVKNGDQLTLSWSEPGFVLQENANLNTPSGWTNVPGGSTSPVNITIPANGSKFYRLLKP